MTPAETRRHCRLDPGGAKALAEGHERLGLSGRGHERVLRVARTIADLRGERADRRRTCWTRRLRGTGAGRPRFDRLRRLPSASAPARPPRALHRARRDRRARLARPRAARARRRGPRPGGGGREGRSLLDALEARPSPRPEANARRSGLLGDVPPSPRLSRGTPRPRRRGARGADGKGRPGAARPPRRRPRRHARRLAARQRLRPRRRARARPDARRSRPAGDQRARARRRHGRAPRGGRGRGSDDRGPRQRSRPPLSTQQPAALRAHRRRGRCRRLRASARGRRVSLDVSGPQPDHGRARRDDGRGRGGASAPAR